MTHEHTPRMPSVLGDTAVIIGNVTGRGDLEIRGRVQGSVYLTGRVFVSETGIVLGGIEATTIAISGEVRGDLNARDGVEIQAQGTVEGNIVAPRVGIEAGARVRGVLRTGAELSSPNVVETGARSKAEAAPSLAIPRAPAHQPATPLPTTPRRPIRDELRPPAAHAQRPAQAMSDMLDERLDTSPRFPADDALGANAEEVERPHGRPRKRRRPRKPEMRSTTDPAPEASLLRPDKNERAAALAPPLQGPAQDASTVTKKPLRPKGAPLPPTFVKGAKGHQRS